MIVKMIDPPFVQAEGRINGYGFYIRARGDQWSLEIYTGPEGPWEYEEDYYAGWMEKEKAKEFIYKALSKLFHVEAQTARIAELEAVVKEIISQIDQGGSGGKVFSRDYCIQRARKVLEER